MREFPNMKTESIQFQHRIAKHPIIEVEDLLYKSNLVNQPIDDLINLNIELEKLISNELENSQGLLVTTMKQTMRKKVKKRIMMLYAMQEQHEQDTKHYLMQIERMNHQDLTLYLRKEVLKRLID